MNEIRLGEEQWGTELQPGTVIARRYRITGIVGRGGMGAVYAAEDLRLPGRRWAVKLTESPAPDHAAQGRARAEAAAREALREAQMLMRLSHPYLPVLADCCGPDADGRIAMVTAYVEGETLHAYAARLGRPLKAAELVPIARQLSEVLAYLHRQSPAVIHRDLKPGNVMLEPGGHLKLIDFGIARYYSEEALTDTQLLGTPGFAAPEQGGAAQSDARADIYGLGALLYWLVSGGRHPRAGEALRGMRFSRLPRALTALLERMLELDPARRPASMQEVRETLHVLSADLVGGGALASFQAAEPLATRTLPGAPKRLVIASLAPGSGATFVALTIAKLLAHRRQPFVALEHPLGAAQWHALLPESQRSAGRDRQGPQSEYPYRGWRDGGSWYALEPSHARMEEADSAAFERLASESAAPLAVIDLSGRWTDPAVAALLEQAEHCLFVADPWPARWRPRAVGRLRELSEARASRGLRTFWAANKDLAFAGREEWLRMVPAELLCALPELPSAQWADCLWRGRWLTDSARWRKLYMRRLEPLWAQIQT
ncbi:serine/threonine protein kinase [Paenibacillus sp. IB182496]|uniref:Serine/threonine protein kinase n=1 Tax=Paenibacillus sabuli TaxID=2772509 RepID=A0A927BW55_9BACL|nr:serine/threonine-protein kinase [Paenibacillus sabuli]MBD2847961.1 serine/threonine protein kinase [Paenibacillus sabuli]